MKDVFPEVYINLLHKVEEPMANVLNNSSTNLRRECFRRLRFVVKASVRIIVDIVEDIDR